MNSTGRHGGHTVRLQRIWKHERAVIIPYDHGAYSGVVKGLEDPVRLTERIAATAADAILVAPGVLRAVAPVVGSLGVVLRMDGAFTAFAGAPADYQMLATAEDAVRLGADAGIIFTFIGIPDESASLMRLGRTAADADIWGLPLISEILPPGLLNNHFGSGIFPKGRKNADVAADTRNVARIAVETGADIVKTRYTGDVESFRAVVETCGAPVIVAGGPKLDGTDDATLRLAHDSVRAGAAGIIFGRNVWQHPKMEKLIAALCAIVHDMESVDSARKLLR